MKQSRDYRDYLSGEANRSRPALEFLRRARTQLGVYLCVATDCSRVFADCLKSRRQSVIAVYQEFKKDTRVRSPMDRRSRRVGRTRLDMFVRSSERAPCTNT